MRKILLGLCLFFLLTSGHAQNGLEKIIVEKYYVSDATDAANSAATLPAGSVTWRIYVDMLPGYKFQVAYGSPTHTLLMTTTTSFFNHPDYGSFSPSFSATNAKKNTVMLDSWLSTGGACTGFLGIMKSEDNGVGNFVNSNNPKLLQNNDASAGIPLTTQDGMIAGTVPGFTTIGFTNETDVFNDGTANGNTFTTNNGGWTCLAGAVGPTTSNRVLIAQITTDGIFHYELNIQIGTPSGGTEKYVASNPLAGEIYDPNLHLSGTLPPVPPTISITAPTGGSTFNDGDVVAIAANATDADGTVASVEFFVDAVSLGVDNTAPYTANYTAVGGSHNLTAIATDNDYNKTTSAPVAITVNGNIPPIVSITAPSNGAKIITGDVVSIAANATDPDGTVTKVEFFVNGNKVGESLTAPYKFDWTSVKGDPTLITAQATDDGGAKDTAQVSVSVKDNQAPIVNITSGAGIIKVGPYLIIANARDTDGTVAKVEFFVDGSKVGEAVSAPYQYSWTNNVSGRHTLTAKATDNRGASTTSLPVINETDAPPTISITAPLAGASYKGGETVAVAAVAADADGTVVSVEFFVDGVSVGIDNTAPYTANYIGIAGSHTLTAKAIDNSGVPTTSDPVSIMVNTLPTVSITSPAAGSSSKVGEAVTIIATATDVDGTVASVEFFVDDVSVGIDNTAPYTANYIGVAGSHTLTAKATDNNGGQTISPPVIINITPTNISDINSSVSTFIIYPNPVTDVVTLDITTSRQSKNISYKVINMKGQVIINKVIRTMSNRYLESINISSLANGQYTIELSVDGSVLSQRIIKQ